MPYRPAVARGSLGEVERRIKTSVYTPLAALAASAWVTPEPMPYGSRRDGRELRLAAGQRWSEAVFDCAWFLFTGTVPDSAFGQDVVLLIDISGEGCVVDAEGRPLLGLTNGETQRLLTPRQSFPALLRSYAGRAPRIWLAVPAQAGIH